MRNKSKRGVHDQTGLCLDGGPALYFERWLMVLAGGLLFILTCSGCSTLRLYQMQQHAAHGDDEWIVAQPVDCNTTAQGCARLHLTKGEACLRLANQGNRPDVHFACAVEELGRGIALQPSGKEMDDALAMHEAYCSALDGLQGLQSGPAADKTRDRLLRAAQDLYQLAPDSVPAIYYISTARLRQLAPQLETITAADRLPVCSRLKRTVNQVLSLMESAKGEHLPAWDRFAERYQQLAFELGAALHTAQCR